MDEAHALLAGRQGRHHDRLPAGAHLHAHQRGLVYRAHEARLLKDRGTMVAFTLPKNSKVTQGKTYSLPAAKPGGTRKVKTFRVYRRRQADGQTPKRTRGRWRKRVAGHVIDGSG